MRSASASSAFRTPPAWREIVGVVGDVRIAGLEQDSPVQVYGAYLQEPALLGGSVPAITVLGRTTRDPASIGEEMKARILTVDKSQPVFAIQPMTQVVSDSLAQRRFSLILLGVFAAFALLLAAIGLYGVISYSVAQRTSELGLRMALGARPGQVLRMVQKQGLSLVAIGTLTGIAGALALTHLMRSMVFGVSVSDPLTFICVALLLCAIAMSACYIPARRATRVDPVLALRHE